MTGKPLPWRQALHMTAAEQLRHLTALFHSLEWWRLLPTQELVLKQPGEAVAEETIVASKSEAGDLMLVYTPVSRSIELNLGGLQENLRAEWFNPRNGERVRAEQTGARETAYFETPSEGDSGT